MYEYSHCVTQEFDVGRTGSIDFTAFEKLYHSIVNVKAVSVTAQNDVEMKYMFLIRSVTGFTITQLTNKVLILQK